MGVKITGVVVSGNRIGRTLGFPTANVVVAPTERVASGVYAARVAVRGVSYSGMVNIGYKPSISEELESRVLEINIFDFDQIIYGEIIEVELVEFIRPERRFESLDQLKAQVDRDREEIIKIMKLCI